jgi:hypothetical protein
MTTATTGIKVPRLDKGKGFKGPEFYGCFNTGMAPAIFHSRTGKYVVGREIPCRDAMQAGACLDKKRTWGGKDDARRKVFIFKGRESAVAKFLELCGEQILQNHNIRVEHIKTARAAAAGDMAAVLALGDY